MQRIVRFTTVLVIVALAVFANPAMASTSLTLSLPQKPCLVGEPVYVVASLTNTGTSDVTIFECLESGGGFLKISITGPDGKLYEHRPLGLFDLAANAFKTMTRTIPPGKSVSHTIDLTPIASNVEIFYNAGKYELRATYTLAGNIPGGPAALTSAVSLEVIQPAGADLAAYQVLLAAQKAGRNGIWNTDPGMAKYYQEIIRKHAQSKYAVISRFYLANIRNYEATQTLRGTPKARPAYVEAAKLFGEAGKLAGDTPLGLYAKRLCARCQAKLGNAKEALKLLDAVYSSPSATDSDREEAISWKEHVKSGYFSREPGLPPKS